MMEKIQKYPLILVEMERAKKARAEANEGMARVCARRAAGLAAGEYVARRGLPHPGSSAYDRLNFLSQNTAVPFEIRQIAGHFLVHVTPDHTLPLDADLLQDAHWLIEKLLE
jgi:hypothetical protein